MNITPVTSTPSYALTDKDRKMIDDLLVNNSLLDESIENYDDLAAALSDSNTIVNTTTVDVDFSKLLDVRV